MLSENGYADRFNGLIDRDSGVEKIPPGVYSFDRYCKENYFFDPLNVYAWCLENDMQVLADLPVFEDLSFGMSQDLFSIELSQLQSIVDFFAKKIVDDKEYLSANPDVSLHDRSDVVFSNAEKLSYPKFLLDKSGKDMKQAFARLNYKINVANLEPQFRKGPAWPMDIVRVMQLLSEKTAPEQI